MGTILREMVVEVHYEVCSRLSTTPGLLIEVSFITSQDNMTRGVSLSLNVGEIMGSEHPMKL